MHLQEAADGAADAPPAKKPRVEAGAEGAQARYVEMLQVMAALLPAC